MRHRHRCVDHNGPDGWDQDGSAQLATALKGICQEHIDAGTITANDVRDLLGASVGASVEAEPPAA